MDRTECRVLARSRFIWNSAFELRSSNFEVAPQVGLEPTTLRLTAGCSTIELLRNGSRQVPATVRGTISESSKSGWTSSIGRPQRQSVAYSQQLLDDAGDEKDHREDDPDERHGPDNAFLHSPLLLGGDFRLSRAR